VRDTFTYTRGHHSLKFGGEVMLQKDVQDTLLNNYGPIHLMALRRRTAP